MTTEAPPVPAETPEAVPDPPLVSAVPVSAPVQSPEGENGAVEQEREKILDLVALTPKRRLVKLPTKTHPEGQDFELRLIDDFGIETQQKLMAWSRIYQKLMAVDRDELQDDGSVLTKDERARLKFVFENLFEHVLAPPPGMSEEDFVEAKRAMDDAARGRVVTTFSWMPVVGRQEVQSELVRRLIEKGHLKQEHLDQVVEEMRQELAPPTTAS